MGVVDVVSLGHGVVEVDISGLNVAVGELPVSGGLEDVLVAEMERIPVLEALGTPDGVSLDALDPERVAVALTEGVVDGVVTRGLNDGVVRLLLMVTVAVAVIMIVAGALPVADIVAVTASVLERDWVIVPLAVGDADEVPVLVNELDALK